MNLMDLANEHDALILAHNYQTPEIQDVAHHVGDSLALAKIAAESQASTIVLCGVYFMAETAKILSPEKRVISPNLKLDVRWRLQLPQNNYAHGKLNILKLP